MAYHHHGLMNEESLSSYISEIKKFPILGQDEEYQLARLWKEKGDKKALEKIIGSHLRLVMKIAQGYAGYGLSQEDLIAEGNIGIMHALQHFDPSIGYRFSTYAAWWIKSKIQDFIYNSWSIVKLGSTKNHRKLFFGLRKMKNVLGIDKMTEEGASKIAEKMNVSKQEVLVSDNRFTYKDFSANSPMGEEDTSSWQDFLADTQENAETKTLREQEFKYRQKILHDALNTLSKREYDVLCAYRLNSPTKTLKEIGDSMGISAERARQIEKRAFLKMQKYVHSLEHKTPTPEAYKKLAVFFMNVPIC